MKFKSFSIILLAALAVGNCYTGRAYISDNTYDSIKKNASQNEVRSILNFDGYRPALDGLGDTDSGAVAESYGGCDISPLTYVPILNLFAPKPKCNGISVIYDRGNKVQTKVMWRNRQAQ